MHIVIDMQGAQTSSRFRGIGRYTRGIVAALIDFCKKDKVTLLLNGMLPEGQKEVFANFSSFVPLENIRVWNGPMHSPCQNGPGAVEKMHAEKCYEDALIELKPDAVLLTSVLAESENNFTCSLARISQYAVICAISYDFLPMHSPDRYLGGTDSPLYQLYLNNMEMLKFVDIFFAISEVAATVTKTVFPLAESVNIGTDVDSKFHPIKDIAQLENITKKYGITDNFIFYAGGDDCRKKLDEILAAYLSLTEDMIKHTQLVFAAEYNRALDRNLRLKELLNKNFDNFQDRIIFTGFLDDDELVCMYSACSLFVFSSCEEGFGLTALEAMRCGAPVVAARSPSLLEVLGGNGALYAPGDVSSFAKLMARALSEVSFNNQLRKVSQEREKFFSWKTSATRGRDVLREFVQNKKRKEYPEEPFHLPDEKFSLATKQQKNFFIDISNLVKHSHRTETPCVVQKLVDCLLRASIDDYVIRPVYFCNDQKLFLQAHTFLLENMLWDDLFESDQPVKHTENDFFLRLDMCVADSFEKKNYTRKMHDDGVCIYTVVYDLIPVEHPEYAPESPRNFSEWLTDLSNFDGAVCTSKATADSLRNWQQNFAPFVREGFAIEWFHLGNSVENSTSSYGLPEDAQEVLDIVQSMPTVLMVGTTELRNGCNQALDAFDLLWQNGENVTLVSAGSDGWEMDAFIKRVAEHPQLGKKLFRLKHTSNQYLEELCKAASVVLIASEVEGSGMSVIDAVRYKKPLILRDNPVFREIAGENAMYFSGGASELANTVLQWIALDASGATPASEGIRCLTWEESAHMLLEKIPLKESSKPLTVLFNTWPAAFDCPGGGEIQLLQYEKHLTEAGVRVLRYDPWNPQFDEADLLHTFSVMGGTWFLPYYAHEVRKLPVVSSPIIWFDQPEKYAMEEIATTLRLADLILPNSIAECGQLQKYFGIASERLTPIYNGIDDPFFEPVPEEIFRDHFNMRDEFVLCMGNIEPRKNQLNLIRALAGSDIKLVVIGQERDLTYATQCRHEASENVFFLGKVPHGSPLQRSAYEAAKAVVLPSVLETPGLSVLEAAASGTPVVVTAEGCAEEYFGPHGIYCAPDSLDSIRDAISLAVTLPKNLELRRHVFNKFRWQNIVKDLIASYHEAISIADKKKGNCTLIQGWKKRIVFICASETTNKDALEKLKESLNEKFDIVEVYGVEVSGVVLLEQISDCYIFADCLPTEDHIKAINKQHVFICISNMNLISDYYSTALLKNCFFVTDKLSICDKLQNAGHCVDFQSNIFDPAFISRVCSGSAYPQGDLRQQYLDFISLRRILAFSPHLLSSQRCQLVGWFPMEMDGIWSEKNVASISLNLKPANYSCYLELKCLSGIETFFWDQLDIIINSQRVKMNAVASPNGCVRTYVTANAVSVCEKLTIDFIINGEMYSPNKLKINDDGRKLGVCIKNINVELL